MAEISVTVTLDGVTKRIITDPDRSILEALREELRETGTGHRCGQGRCGGCVVLLNDRRVLSCDYPIGKADGGTITTVP